jgi:hypothetical protein
MLLALKHHLEGTKCQDRAESCKCAKHYYYYNSYIMLHCIHSLSILYVCALRTLGSKGYLFSLAPAIV